MGCYNSEHFRGVLGPGKYTQSSPSSLSVPYLRYDLHPPAPVPALERAVLAFLCFAPSLYSFGRQVLQHLSF